MQDKYYEFLNTRKFKGTLMITLLVILVGYSIVYKKKANAALKDNDLVEAIIVDITPSRSSTRIHVEYFL